MYKHRPFWCPVVKNPLSNAGNVGSTPDWETKSPHATGQLSLYAATAKPMCSGAQAPWLQKPEHHDEGSHVTRERSCVQQLRPDTAKWVNNPLKMYKHDWASIVRCFLAYCLIYFIPRKLYIINLILQRRKLKSEELSTLAKATLLVSELDLDPSHLISSHGLTFSLGFMGYIGPRPIVM